MSNREFLKKFIRTAGKANTFTLFGPKSWTPQTDYNPVPPGSHKTSGTVDMRPKAVAEREKAAKNSLIVPLVTIAGVVAVLVLAIIIKSIE
ncbi:MAG: hypothetical protein IKW01_06435 [Firmicutes bacterium]|nr:hypothetical protein [Bacillota bacterium]